MRTVYASAAAAVLILVAIVWVQVGEQRRLDQLRRESCAGHAGQPYYETCLAETEPD